jgi:hypothetical protein
VRPAAALRFDTVRAFGSQPAGGRGAGTLTAESRSAGLRVSGGRSELDADLPAGRAGRAGRRRPELDGNRREEHIGDGH